MRKALLSTFAALGIAAFAAPVVWAQDEPEATGVVAYRQSTMGSFGANMGAIKAILTEYPELKDNVEVHARYIADMGDKVPAMFPEGTGEPPSEALPAVWDNPEEFEQHSTRMSELATQLADAVPNSEVPDLLPMFAQLGKEGCGNCHDDFRMKDE